MTTALIIGDVQRGILEAHPWSRNVLAPLRRVLDHARKCNLPVIYVTVALRGVDGDVARRNPVAVSLAAAGELYLEGTPQTQVHPAVAPRDDEPVVVKRRASAFAGTDLDAVLRARDATSILLAGVATSGIVLATALAACDLDYAVTVLSDCCADPDATVHAILTRVILPGRGARVRTSDDWISSEVS